MNNAEIGKDGARPAINEGHLEHVVGGVNIKGTGIVSYTRYCENCKVPTPHTPTASGSYCCNVCGYDPAKKSDD